MTNDSIASWVQKAKAADAATPVNEGVKVIRREEPKATKGQVIMDVAEKLFPALMELFRDVRDKKGLLLQPAHVRGIALNMAQNLVNNKE